MYFNAKAEAGMNERLSVLSLPVKFGGHKQMYAR